MKDMRLGNGVGERRALMLQMEGTGEQIREGNPACTDEQDETEHEQAESTMRSRLQGEAPVLSEYPIGAYGAQYPERSKKRSGKIPKCSVCAVKNQTRRQKQNTKQFRSESERKQEAKQQTTRQASDREHEKLGDVRALASLKDRAEKRHDDCRPETAAKIDSPPPAFANLKRGSGRFRRCGRGIGLAHDEIGLALRRRAGNAAVAVDRRATGSVMIADPKRDCEYQLAPRPAVAGYRASRRGQGVTGGHRPPLHL